MPNLYAVVTLFEAIGITVGITVVVDDILIERYGQIII